MNGLMIGSVAKLAKVNIETMRYYERRGLVPRPLRNASNYRLYPIHTVDRVRFIKHAQELGFTLKEIMELLILRVNRSANSAEVRRRVQSKIEDIDVKIASLRAKKDSLSKLVKKCSGMRGSSPCSILASMDLAASR